MKPRVNGQKTFDISRIYDRLSFGHRRAVPKANEYAKALAIVIAISKTKLSLLVE